MKHPAFSFKDVITLDLRSLALYRIVLAVTILYALCHYVPYYHEFLSDSGLYPRYYAMNSAWHSQFSLYMISGYDPFTILLLIATVISALALLFGYYTQIATILCWVLWISLSSRVFYLQSGADSQLSLYLFWAMFLPTGAVYSVDAGRSKEQVQSYDYRSIATLAILLQVTYLYFFGALLKTNPVWNENFQAIYYAQHALQFAGPLSLWLREQVVLMKYLTIYVYYLELFAIILLFSPLFSRLCKLIVVILLIFLHLGFLIFMNIGYFPFASLAGLCALLPSLFWDRLSPLWRRITRGDGVAMYYDPGCGFCEKICSVFRSLCLPRETEIQPASVDPKVNAILERDNSWVVQTHDGAFLTKWEAVSYVWRRSPLLWPLGVLFALPIFKQIGSGLYFLIARYRPALSRVTAKILPWREGSGVFYPGTIGTVAIGVLVALVLYINLRTVLPQLPKLQDDVFHTANFLRLNQRWSMFAPYPVNHSIWVVVEGKTEDGRKVDMLRGTPKKPRHRRPAHGQEAYPNGFAWIEYFTRINLKNARKDLGRYYCSQPVPGRPGQVLDTITVTRYVQTTPAPGKKWPKPRRKRVEYICGEEDQADESQNGKEQDGKALNGEKQDTKSQDDKSQDDKS